MERTYCGLSDNTDLRAHKNYKYKSVFLDLIYALWTVLNFNIMTTNGGVH